MNDGPIKPSKLCTSLTIQELDTAETEIIRFIQSQSFERELQILERANNNLNEERSCCRKDWLHSSPQPNHGQRCTTCWWSIKKCRYRLCEKYWIVGANSAVHQLISFCFTCRRIKAPPQDQKMADPPKDRLTPAPPFTCVGVDYFGPFTTKQGRRKTKGMEHCSRALLAELFT